MDSIRNLPPQIAKYIFTFLGPDDIDTVWNHIEEWRGIISNENFWKEVCQRSGYQKKDFCLSTNIYMKFFAEYSREWQAIYKFYRLIDSNWMCWNFRRIELEEEKMYNDINYLDDDIIVVSDIDDPSNHKTDIIKLSTGKILFSLNEGIMFEVCKYQDLLGFIRSNTVKVWDFQTTSWILNVEIEDPQLYEVGYNYIQIFNNLVAVINSRFCLRIYNLASRMVYLAENVRDVCFGDNMILYVKENKNVQVLDLDCRLIMYINYEADLQLLQNMIKRGLLVCFCRDDENPEWRKVTVYTIHPATNSVHERHHVHVTYQRVLRLNDDTLLFWNGKQNAHPVYYIWRFATDNFTYRFPSVDVTLDLAISNSSFMFICNEEAVLNMWNFKTGLFIRRMEDVRSWLI